MRSLPATMSAADVVKAAKAKGIILSDKYVHTIRYNAKSAKRPASAPSAAAASSPNAGTPAKRGPGRPRGSASARVAAPASSGNGGGLVAEIERLVERVVERKIGEVLRAKLGAIV